MTSQTQTTAETASTDDAEPEYIMSTYPDGTITISMEGFKEEYDGLPIMTFTQYGGVEKGMSTIFATSGKSSFFCFEGSYAEQKQVFDQWARMAEANTRPQVYRDEGIKALVDMGPAIYPPFPEIDITGSEDMNRIAELSYELSKDFEAKAGRELTFEDFRDVVSASIQAARELDASRR